MALDILSSRSRQLGELLESDKESAIHAFEFEIGDTTFTTVDKIPLSINRCLAIFGDTGDDITEIERLNIIENGTVSLIQKDQKRAFRKAIYDEGLDLSDLINILFILLEEMGAIPLESSSSESTTSETAKKKSTPRSSSAVKK